jgi:hypothetical protein
VNGGYYRYFYATYVHHRSHTDGLGSNREFLGDSPETIRMSHEMIRHYSVEPHSLRVILNLWVKVKVKEPRNRLGVAQRVPGGIGSQIS